MWLREKMEGEAGKGGPMAMVRTLAFTLNE